MNAELSGDLTVLMTFKDVCHVARISERHLYRLVSSGEFPGGIKLGRRRLWHPSELDDFLRRESRKGDRNKVLAKKTGIKSSELSTPAPEPKS